MRRRDTARKSLAITAGSVTNVVLGLAFQLLLANELGLSPTVDLYTLGTMVPTFLATILLGSTPSVLVPAFTRLSSTRADGTVPVRVLTVATAGVVALSVLVAGVTVLTVPLLGEGLPDTDRGALVQFVVITAVAVPLAWIAAVSQAVLILRERFLIVGLAGASNGLGLLVAAAAVFLADQPVPGLAFAFVAGYAMQVAVQSVAASRWMSWEPAAASTAIVRSLAVLVGAALIYKSQPIIERVLSAYVEGGPAVLNYASKVSQALLMASSLGLALISLPAISRHVSDDDHPRAFRVATSISFAICCISAPLVTTAILANSSVIGLLYGRGAFGPEDVALVAGVLAVAAAGVLFSAMTGPIVNLLYATSRYVFVASVSVITTIGGGLLSWWLREPWGLAGIALGSTIAFSINFFIYWIAAAASSRARGLAAIARPLAVITVTALAAWGGSLIPIPGGLPDVVADILRLAVVGVCAAAASLLAYLRLRRRDGESPEGASDSSPSTAP